MHLMALGKIRLLVRRDWRVATSNRGGIRQGDRVLVRNTDAGGVHDAEGTGFHDWQDTTLRCPEDKAAA